MTFEPSCTRTPADSPDVLPSRPATEAVPAPEFLSHAIDLVDLAEAERLHGDGDGPFDILSYLNRKHSSPQPAGAGGVIPPRFKREPYVFVVGNVRFGRTRLFLSKFIGDLAWRGVSL
ncbi:MAG TPA: hypothetical protein VND66_08180 [Acidobacteriaceae bacterium]|nr:hypothetical protein [Acidobacteriaceae bacterium]